jgi:hypothetical protein
MVDISNGVNVNDFLQALAPFVWGFVLGYFWHPVWNLCKRIYEEAKLAKYQWRNPNGNRDD